MNKILIRNGIIDNLNDDNYIINDNQIIFKNSGIYYIEYLGNMDINLTLIVDGGINVLLIETSFSNELNVNNHYIVKDGLIKINKFYCNRNVNEKIVIDLMNVGSEVDYYFSNICVLEEKYEININHLNKKTVSNISNKSVALNNSKLNFVINSNVSQEMDESFLDQTTRIITFGECDAKVLPNMFIDLDNVIAKHGSVIGTIKDEMIFYLMSRGIERNDAIKLIIKGYLFSNVSLDYDLRSKIFKIIDMYWR